MSEIHWQLQRARHEPSTATQDRCKCGEKLPCRYRTQADEALEGRIRRMTGQLTLV